MKNRKNNKDTKFTKSTNKDEFVNFVNIAKSQLNTSYIPESVFEKLPEFLKKGCEKFTDKRKRDVYLTSALGVLSGCLPNVSGFYGDQVYYPNLFTLILAPAASGKSSMRFADQLARPTHIFIRNQYKQELDEYKKEKLAFDLTKDSSENPPVQPTSKQLIFPGNISSSSLYDLLNNNDGKGIIIETEADTLVNSLSKEWGSFSDLLRKSFGHEPVSLSRKTDGELIEVDEPKLSMVLTGTPNQMFNLLSNAENGLVSRFMYYIFESEREFKSQRPVRDDLQSFFKNQGHQVKGMIDFLSKNPTEIIFNNDQWEEHETFFNLFYNNIVKLHHEHPADGILFRLGVMMFKICMILTSLRKFESMFDGSLIDCHPDDFEIAKKLASTYLEHGLVVYNNLPKSSSHDITPPKQAVDRLFEGLNEFFSRYEAISKGSQYGLSASTVDKSLKKAVDKNEISRIKAGFYAKKQTE